MRQQQSYCVSMGKRKERNGIERICEYTYVYIYIKFISDESCWFSWFICSTSTLSIEFGVIISALSKIRITSTEHYMCTVTISYRFASSFSYRFGSYILFSHIFFLLFRCIFRSYLIFASIPFQLHAVTVILHKTTNYFYIQT